MIASLHGIVAGLRENSIIVQVGGVGLEVFVPLPTYNELTTEIGSQIDLSTYLVVREDALQLYGFRESEERELFTLLLTVSGIGPRSALSVLSSISTETLANAVQNDNADLISRVPGIGKKTAQKIVLELKGKLHASAMPPGMAAVSVRDTEVIEALTALGYSIVEAQAAIQSIPRDADADVEERIRLALGYFNQ
jgi:holliday junction DNA helicase RuvA